jgi:nucleotidyltransferase substrate binding protein (TIGR01987 family)
MTNKDEIRWQLRFENFLLALRQLEAACAMEEYSELEFAGLIKNFEIAFEMAWKTLKDLLMYEGFDVNSPRSTIQQAFDSGLISDLSPWIEALESRNILTHKYDKNAATDAETIIKTTFLPMLRAVMETLRKRKDRK